MSEHARVLFFATLRDKTGVKEARMEFPNGTRIVDLKAMILEKFPDLKSNMDTLIVALNHEYAFDEDIVPDGAEIAFVPPVSGGEANPQEYPTVISVIDHEIDVNDILAKITLPSTGGICTFTGTVRGVTRRGVQHETKLLTYEAYQVMAKSKMRQICEEIRSKWENIEGIALVQRVGTLKPGTVTVVVACSASHRDTGIFEAARYGIDRLKEIVPIWKKEMTDQGEEWLEGKYIPRKGE